MVRREAVTVGVLRINYTPKMEIKSMLAFEAIYVAAVLNCPLHLVPAVSGVEDFLPKMSGTSAALR